MKRIIKASVVSAAIIDQKDKVEVGEICTLWFNQNGESAYAEVEKISKFRYESTTYGWVYTLRGNDVYREGKLVGTYDHISF